MRDPQFGITSVTTRCISAAVRVDRDEREPDPDDEYRREDAGDQPHHDGEQAHDRPHRATNTVRGRRLAPMIT
jgi:hypothetical protein